MTAPTFALAGPKPRHAKFFITLHTRLAISALVGRMGSDKACRLPGLMRFAALTKAMWLAAKADDPYADWWLYKAEQGVQDAHDRLAGTHAQLEDRLGVLEGIEFTGTTSDPLVREPLVFACPLAYQGASLVTLLDRLILCARASNDVALLTGNAASAIAYKALGTVTKAWFSANGYRRFGVTRVDVLKSTPLAVAAHNALGPLPDDIYTGERRAACLSSLARPVFMEEGDRP